MLAFFKINTKELIQIFKSLAENTGLIILLVWVVEYQFLSYNSVHILNTILWIAKSLVAEYSEQTRWAEKHTSESLCCWNTGILEQC